MTSPTRHAEPIEGHPGLHRVTDGHVNAWIVEADDHLVLVDCGLPTTSTCSTRRSGSSAAARATSPASC